MRGFLKRSLLFKETNMTIKCDALTRGELNGATNKTHWGQLLNNALGSARRIRCFRDSNASATDPFATGIEFRNVGSTGTLKIVSGKVVSLGKIKGTTIALAADMSTGKSIVRIEGNGRWIQGSLGLVGSDADFVTFGSFTDTNGLGITPNFAISGRRFLASGTGPAAPALNASSPATLEIWDWTNPQQPKLSGVIPYNNRIDDFVYEDAEMAAENGDVAVYQSTLSVLLGEHEFGSTMMVSHAGNTVIGGVPLYEIMINTATRGTWTNYPTVDTFKPTEVSTHPLPWKGLLKDSQGNLLHTFQQQDGLPINSPDLEYISWWDPINKPVRPPSNTGMVQYWCNTKAKVSSKMNKWYPGLTTDGARPSQAKWHFTFLASPPLITGGYQRNSYNGMFTFWGNTQWPRPYGVYYDPNPDPYLSSDFNRSGSSAFSAPWACGYDYEPGSFSAHDWYTGPGGPRQDRCVMPSTLVMFATDPNGRRLQGNVPWRDVADGYCKAYWNHSNHWVRDVKTMQLAPNKEFIEGKWQTLGNYYGDAPTADPSRAIQFMAVPNAASRDTWNNDKTGRMFWGGWARDTLHSYGEAGWAAMLFNSPAYALASKFDMVTQLMMSNNPNEDVSSYMVRTQAWNWLHYVFAWKLASQHPLSFNRQEIEDRFALNLEKIHDRIYVPTFVDNNQEPAYQSLRNLGTWALDGKAAAGGGLGFYMAHVLCLMKQTGMWSAIRQRGGKAWTALQMQMRNMDEYAFGFIVNTSGQWGHYTNWSEFDRLPTSWSDLQAMKSQRYTPAGTTEKGDWIHLGSSDWDDNEKRYITPDHPRHGQLNSERDVADHLPAQYVYIRKAFFPEIPHPLLDAAVAKYAAYHKVITDAVAAMPTPGEKTGRDHGYRYPGLAPIKAPLELGPA
jgi:hypothetical protein